MARIKIISNPYEKCIQYCFWNVLEERWKPIDYANNANSQLISEELTTSFFPFKANHIVDVIVDEFNDGHIDLSFAGTEDEFNMLNEICKEDKYSSLIALTRESETLENARDILPDIVDIFKEIKPLISQSVRDKSKIETELGKFTEATNEIIPVCIVGNYSAGKSTFINALIGHEILPSGDEPVTARIYKISPSHYEDRGRIKFSYEGTDVIVRFRGNNQGIDSDLEDCELLRRIQEVIAPLDTVDLIKSINRTLQTINNFENEILDDGVSDLIEIEVPFNSSMVGRGKTDFVIFDTPGSNSASNSKHVRVLKQAMENMSNGLPIFVSEFNSLDSMDNENLYKEINALEELDSRFTMVVVNKSDKANLPVDGFTQLDEDRILNMSIPKNLYGSGIYFVSSVIGLGAKTKGEFEDEFYEEIYDDTYQRFADPKHKRYKSLYKFNIMPDQLKKEAVEESEDCSDLLLANSGLYCVEQEINNFAAVYSGYNKCIQSELFLGKVHDITSSEIRAAVEERAKSMDYRSTMLETDKQKLVVSLEKTAENMRLSSVNEYKAYMNPVYKGLNYGVNPDALKATEIELKSKYRQMVEASEKKDEEKPSTDALFDKVVMEKKPSTLKRLAINYETWRKEYAKQTEIEKDVRSKAINELFGDIKDKYKASNDDIHNVLMSKSIEYWNNQTTKARNTLVDLVTGSSALDDSKKVELESLILSYEAMKFKENSEIKLDKDKFEMKLFSVFAIDPLNINRRKLARAYNSEIVRSKEGNYRNVYVSHVDSYNKWIRNLVELLVSNIVDINPTLAAQSEIIKEETQRIEDLENRQRKLDQYVNQIHRMMQWCES